MNDENEQNFACTRTIICHTGPATKSSGADMAHYIVVAAGSEKSKKVEIGLVPLRIGRSIDNDLSLPDPFVSSHHCQVYFEEGQIWVADHGSTNGSFIEGEQISGKRLWPISASLQIGKQVLRHEYRRRADSEDADNLAKDLRKASNYVQSLLPPPLPEGAVSAAWQFQPSTELGGDVFDYFWLDAEHFGFYLLDVSGHGVGAALHSVSVFNLLRQRSLPGIDFSRPSQVMRVLNNAFPMERYGSMYFTLWYGVYHLPRQQVCFASAGHPPAIVFSAHQQHPVELFSDNPPLGMVESLLFEEKTFSLALPVRLYLYSDGVYEYTLPSGKVADKPEFVRLLMESQENAGWRPGDIFQALRMKTRAGRFDDDFSLLMLEFAG